MTTTVAPCVHEALEHAQEGLRTSRGCRPMVGSSNTNTASSCARPISLASLRRWASPPGQRGRGLAQREVAQGRGLCSVSAGARAPSSSPTHGVARLVDAHSHELGQRAAGSSAALSRRGGPAGGLPRRSASRGSSGQLDVHVGQELHVQADGARAVARRGSGASPCCTRSRPPCQPGRPWLLGPARKARRSSSWTPGVGGHGGAHVRRRSAWRR